MELALLALLASTAIAQEAVVGSPASQTSPIAFDSSGNAYIAEAISVSAEHRERFVGCLRDSARKRWIALRHKGLLADLSVFETARVRSIAGGGAGWNFLVLAHLPHDVTPNAYFAEAGPGPHFSSVFECVSKGRAAVQRVEVLRPTPRSSYPRVTAEEDLEAQREKVRFIVEYIAVDETPAALAQYRDSMAQNMGAAMGLMIPEKTFFEFKALEEETVKFSRRAVTPWNQIHIRGFYPDKGSAPAESPLALRRVNPSGGAAFFSSLDNIRTKTREDEAVQLYDLAVR